MLGQALTVQPDLLYEIRGEETSHLAYHTYPKKFPSPYTQKLVNGVNKAEESYARGYGRERNPMPQKKTMWGGRRHFNSSITTLLALAWNGALFVKLFFWQETSQKNLQFYENFADHVIVMHQRGNTMPGWPHSMNIHTQISWINCIFINLKMDIGIIFIYPSFKKKIIINWKSWKDLILPLI